ncbi:MAG: carbohydrate-binding protein [Lentisphaerae bacterium]|nr:carbohydrate-binding protein [Lentisphaerota bacterium]
MWIVKLFWSIIVSCVLTGVYAQWKTEVTPDGQSAVFSNDSGDAAIKNKKIFKFSMASNGNWIEKSFDLTALPAEWKNGAGSAAIRIFMQVADQSKAVKKLPNLNGFTEELAIEINGEKKIYPVGSQMFPRSMRWADIPLSADLLKGDKLVLRIGKIKSATNDDYVYIGMDTSATPNGASKISVDGGKSFHYECRYLPGCKGEFMIKLVLFRTAQHLSLDLAKLENAGKFILKNGCRSTDGTLLFDGLQSQAVLKNSETFNVTEKGLTIAAVLRMLPNEPGSRKKDHNMIIAGKAGSWFIGRSGNQINFSFSADGQKWTHALYGSEFPDLGEWFHLAAVFERVNQTAESNVGYLLSLYLNGELAGRKMFFHLTPSASTFPVVLGNCNIKNYGYKGNIAALDLIHRSLNAGEITDLVHKASRISKRPAGFFELKPELSVKINSALANTVIPFNRFLIKAVKRAAETGFDQNIILKNWQDMENLFFSKDAPAQTAEKWNKQLSFFDLTVSGKAVLLTAPGKSSGNSPVLGLFDLHSQRDIFDGRATGWMLNFDGRKIHDYSRGVDYEMTPVKKSADGGTFSVVWKKSGDFEAVSNFTFSGSRLEQDFEVKKLNSKLQLSEADFPRYFFAGLPGKHDKLTFPCFNGLIRQNPANAFGETGIYPSVHCAMQFVSYFDELKNGIYAAFEATDAGVKTLSINGRRNILEYKWSSPVALPVKGYGGNSFKSAGNAVIETYRGGWFEGGQLYKKFIEAKAPWAVRELPRKDTPAWYRDNCLWMASSSEHAPGMIYLREYFDIPYTSWHCQWYNVDKSADANFRIRERDKKMIARLLKNGIYIHPYLNGRVFGIAAVEGDYIDRTGSKNFLENSVVQANGERYYENYGGKYGVMCPGTVYWQERLLDMAKEVSDLGMNGCYYDQLPCSSPRVCYAKNHGHSPGDPTAWANGYWKMLKELRRRHPRLGLDGEDNSEVYANTLDGFMTWRSSEPGHIPLFHSIYGGGRTQFTGRGFDAFGGYTGSYEATFAKLGEQFVWGEQIGWLHIFDIRWGTPRRIYAKKLAHLRRAMLGYLNESDMLAPLEFAEKVPQISSVWGCVRGETITTDKILSCAWKRLRDGRIAVLFTNTTEENITVKPVTRYPGYDKLAVLSEGKKVSYIDLAKNALPAVTLAPHRTEIWLLGKDFDRTEAEKIGKTTQIVASFTDAGKSIHYQSPQFHICKKLTAIPGKWFSAEDSSWLLYAFKEVHPSLGFNPRSKRATEAEKGNWILAGNGGVISYGEVDFTGNAPRFLELQIAVSPENAGTVIRLDDVTGKLEPYHTLAEITTASTGGFFKWKTIRVPLKPVTGKRKIVFNVTGKGCNIRAWRVI